LQSEPANVIVPFGKGARPGKDQERSTRVLNQPCRIHTNTEEESHGEEKGKVEQEEEGFLN
jgi:hypothetical protein